VATSERVRCGSLRVGHAGREVLLFGWVARRRDHGGLIFIDVRDRWGLVQVVFNPADAPEPHERAGELRAEFVVRIEGRVRPRPAGSENADLPTGEIEVLAHSLEIINRSETPPFPVEDGIETEERLRMRYRYLDLRRPEMQRNMELRHRFIRTMRDWLDAQGFIEIETPILFKPTPEGARDYLVPSRVHPGSFYALPQSPQILKQLLMVSGYDRYYQIARCFRDEDLRADRQPEFTQLDLEMSFVTEDDVLETIEGLYRHLWRELAGHEAPPFVRLTFEESMRRFGRDKPDMRFGMELHELNDVLADTQFRVFRSVIDAGGLVAGIALPGQAVIARRQVDALVERARALGAKGLAYMPVGEGVASPLTTNLGERERAALAESLEADRGDLILIVADAPDVVREVLGTLRHELGRDLGLARHGDWAFAWILDMPLFERTDTGEIAPGHHPFTRPRDDDLPLLDSEPFRVRAYAYDLVLNGYEIGGGSLRIHDPELQQRIFHLLGYDEATIQNRFGFMLEAFRYGVPPHGGCAPGIDRACMLLVGADSLRDVIAFPKTQQAQDLMSGAPSDVLPGQLEELALRVRPQPGAPKT
jgi:aspartyl-tRNA synthetase